MAYLLDANAFIEAKRRWYGFDFCPAYWQWLERANARQAVFSIERVADEILAGDDELVPWIQARGESFFLKPDQNVVPIPVPGIETQLRGVNGPTCPVCRPTSDQGDGGSASSQELSRPPVDLR